MDKVIFYSNIRNLIFKKCSIQFLIINDTVAHKEQVAMREMNQLVNTEDSAWPIIQNWLKDATNHTELLGNDSNLLIVFYVQIMPDDFVMQLHR
ncbi:hypothetical protein RYZ44_24280, partial [Escherichia coli]|nr:hypothetical protein [Escherichia coli]MDW2535183.1 hypothetical protein [Escherichia coli]